MYQSRSSLPSSYSSISASALIFSSISFFVMTCSVMLWYCKSLLSRVFTRDLSSPGSSFTSSSSLILALLPLKSRGCPARGPRPASFFPVSSSILLNFARMSLAASQRSAELVRPSPCLALPTPFRATAGLRLRLRGPRFGFPAWGFSSSSEASEPLPAAMRLRCAFASNCAIVGFGASASGSASRVIGPAFNSRSSRFCLAIRSKPNFEALERVLNAILATLSWRNNPPSWRSGASSWSVSWAGPASIMSTRREMVM
mmetsp:Transcript_3373/g.7931  ORF Transcript_3373/g.7931 Transcript_3373/m.7931 type:complete len:258 (+) Transcript_3373:2971-3744(+)